MIGGQVRTLVFTPAFLHQPVHRFHSMEKCWRRVAQGSSPHRLVPGSWAISKAPMEISFCWTARLPPADQPVWIHTPWWALHWRFVTGTRSHFG